MTTLSLTITSSSSSSSSFPPSHSSSIPLPPPPPPQLSLWNGAKRFNFTPAKQQQKQHGCSLVSFNPSLPLCPRSPVLSRAAASCGHLDALQTAVGSDLVDENKKLQIKHVASFLHTTTFLIKLLICTLSSTIFSFFFLPHSAFAVSESIASSGLGMRIASLLRQSGWADQTIIIALAMLPILELRGAIPVGYWMHLEPWKIYMLSVLGNMIPVPFILLYLEKLSSFLASKSSIAKKFLAWVHNNARKKSGPIQEFRWIGLMLFVAVLFPGTGAWSGAIIAALLGMPFWNAIFANLFGVILAGFLVNLLVTVGLRDAFIVGAGLFVISTFMWRILRVLKIKAE